MVGWLAETQRRLKQLEQVRQAAADRYASMLAATKDAFWLVDAPSGRLLDVNAAAMQMSGFSRDALLSMSMQDLEVGLTTDAYAEQMTQVLTEGWGLFESRQRISAGRIIDVEISVTFDPPSRTLVAFIRDITERKRMEQALLTFNAELEERVARRTEELSATTSALMLTEERLRLAMDATHDGLWDWNLATDEYFTNEAYCSMLGYAAVASPTNVQDQWLNLVHPDERDSTLANVNQALQSVGDYALEFRMRARDGGYRWILSRGRVVERDATAAPARRSGRISILPSASTPRRNCARVRRTCNSRSMAPGWVSGTGISTPMHWSFRSVALPCSVCRPRPR